MVRQAAGAMVCVVLGGCAYGEAITGRAMTEHSRANLELKKQNTRFAAERAKIMEMYRGCLERKEADATVDCSAYRTALEITVSNEK